MIIPKRKNGEVQEVINAEYLPAHYLIPKEIIDRNPKKVREIPRMFAMFPLDAETVATAESDLLFITLIKFNCECTGLAISYSSQSNQIVSWMITYQAK